VLSSICTGGETLDCCFSLTQPYQILTVELHKKAHSSIIVMHEDTHVTQTCMSVFVDVCGTSQIQLYLYLLFLCLGAVTQVSAGFGWGSRTPLRCWSTSKQASRLVLPAPCSPLYWSGILMEA
ncbi:WD repeat-containing and planar cell polarity effector protein fritz homolog isoform X1, partial [Tachysurus ichikawai]